MRILQITPGAGGMYCGGCFHDNTLVAALRRLGHEATLLPLYLPLTLDEADESRGSPLFFSGVNVYLEQKMALFRHAPAWLRRMLASAPVMRMAASAAGKTRPEELGDITVSMLRGEHGHQRRELTELVAFLKSQPLPDIICLSNALLSGLARALKKELNVPIACFLQGEDYFLDGLAEPFRRQAWSIVSERMREMDLIISPSRYFAQAMGGRLGLDTSRVKIVFDGIDLDGYEGESHSPHPPVLGYFARMCREKGLEQVVGAFLLLKKKHPTLRLKIGGGCGPSDELIVSGAKKTLEGAGVLADVEFHPNVTRAEKIHFLKSLTVFSVPAVYSEAFGLYVIEAMAAGVPVVQPRHAAFPEILEATGGGMIVEPVVPALAEGIDVLLQDAGRARALGRAGREAVSKEFSARTMAENTVAAYSEAMTFAGHKNVGLQTT